MRNLLLLSAFLFLGIQLTHAQDDDFTEKGEIVYTGFRVYMSNPEVLSSKKKVFKFKCKLTNTGRQDLRTNRMELYKSLLVIKMDDRVWHTGVDHYMDLLEEQIRAAKLDLAPGESVTKSFTVKIPKERRTDDEAFALNTDLTEKGGTSAYIGRKLCPDFELTDLALVKADNKSAIVEFKVTNVGKGAINIIGDKKDLLDNIVVRAYFSGSTKYSRGALASSEIYLKGLEDTKGIMFPNESVTVRMKVSRKKETRHTRNMIIYVDANKMVMECNETNNWAHINMAGAASEASR